MEGAATQLTAAKPSSNRCNTRNSSKNEENNLVGGRGKDQQQKQQQSQVAQDEENRENGSPDGKRKLTSSPARAKKKLHPTVDSPCRRIEANNGSNNSFNNNNNSYNSSNATSLQFPVSSSSTPTIPNVNNTTTTSSYISSSLQSNSTSSTSVSSSLSSSSTTTATEILSNSVAAVAPSSTNVVTSNSSSISSEAFIQVRGVLQEARFPPTDSEIEAALARNGNSALRTITELLPSSTGVASVVSSSTNGVAASHSSTNNNELRMDIDSSSANGSIANEVSVETLLSIMEDPQMNLYRYVYNGGNHRKLPKDLHKFNDNNILEGYSFVNDSKLEQRAEAEFGDKTRYIRAQTVSAAMPFLCMGMQNSFPVEGVGAERVGPLRVGNEFLESRGINAISTGPTQSIHYRLLATAFNGYFGVDSDTAHVTAAQTTVWLTEAAPYPLDNKAGSKGNKDHARLLRLLEDSAKEVAECNRELIEHAHITDVLGYGNIAQDFLSDNDVLPSGVRVHESPAGSHLIQGPTFRALCEALIAPIAAIKYLIGDNSPLDMDKVMLIAARNFTFYPKVNNAISLRGASTDFIYTASYPIENDDDEQDKEVDLFRGRGVISMGKLLRRKGVQFGNTAFPTQDKFFDSNGELVSVQWKGLTWTLTRWDDYNYFGNDFGTASGGFGAREGSLLQHFIQNHSKAGIDERTALTLVVTKTNDGDITSDDDCMIVCGAALEFLKEHKNDDNIIHAFKKQKLQDLFEGLIFGNGGDLRYDTPISAFGRQALIKKHTYNSIEDMLKVLPVNAEALARAMDLTDISDWVPTLHLFKPPTGNDKPTYIGSISKIKDLQPLNRNKTPNEEYPWPDEQEARPACNSDGTDGTAINAQLGSLQLKAAGQKCKWANGPAVLTAIRDKKSVTIECPTIPSSYKGYDENENKEEFIFAAVRLDKDDDNDDNNKHDDEDDDFDEDQYY